MKEQPVINAKYSKNKIKLNRYSEKVSHTHMIISSRCFYVHNPTKMPRVGSPHSGKSTVRGFKDGTQTAEKNVYRTQVSDISKSRIVN
jgi:hypothetical protein